MKKTLTLMLFLIAASIVFAGNSSRYGYALPTRGDLRIFAVFAEIYNDTLNLVVPEWNRGDMPNIEYRRRVQNYVNNYFREASFGKLNVILDYHPNLVQISMAENRGGDTFVPVFRYLDALVAGGRQIQTAGGLNFPRDFDLWTLTQYWCPISFCFLSQLPPGSPRKLPEPDGYIDFIMVFWRENSRIGATRSGGHVEFEPFFGTINDRQIFARSQIYADGTHVVVHEIAHGFLGRDAFHTAGAGTGVGMFMQDFSGFSMLSGFNQFMRGYNPWDRWRLGWFNPENNHNYEISALNENGDGVNADLIYGQTLSQGDSAVFVLRNFADYGDAVRIKLPFVRSLNPQAREQWIWISNHQLRPGTMEFCDDRHKQNLQMYRLPRGIYLNLQVGNNDFSDFRNSRTNYFSPIGRFGKFDFFNYVYNPIGLRSHDNGNGRNQFCACKPFYRRWI